MRLQLLQGGGELGGRFDNLLVDGSNLRLPNTLMLLIPRGLPHADLKRCFVYAEMHATNVREGLLGALEGHRRCVRARLQLLYVCLEDTEFSSGMEEGDCRGGHLPSLWLYDNKSAHMSTTYV